MIGARIANKSMGSRRMNLRSALRELIITFLIIVCQIKGTDCACEIVFVQINS
jgi:hypothetical protein